jgi:TolB-like protein
MPDDVSVTASSGWQPCRYGSSKLLFRGPSRFLDGPYIAFVGGNETLARSIQQPFPTLIEEQLGETCVNFGQSNASIDVVMHDAFVVDACRGALTTVVAVTGAANISNRFYSVHPRRNDRVTKVSPTLRALYPETDFSQFCFTKHLITHLQSVSASRLRTVVEELQAAWVARMRSYLELIGPNTILAWFAPHLPCGSDELAREVLDPTREPLFVTREMLDAVRPLVHDLVIIRPALASNCNEPLGSTAHRTAADALVVPITEAIRAKSSKRDRQNPEPDVSRADLPITAAERTNSMEPRAWRGRDAQRVDATDIPPPCSVLPRYSKTAVNRPRRIAIAVEPLRLISLSDRGAGLAQILTDEMTRMLFRQQGIDVRQTPDVETAELYSATIRDLQSAELTHLLSGSVSVMDRDVRCTSKLFDLSLGVFTWIESFDRTFPTSLKAIEDLGRDIVSAALSVARGETADAGVDTHRSLMDGRIARG